MQINLNEVAEEIKQKATEAEAALPEIKSDRARVEAGIVRWQNRQVSLTNRLAEIDDELVMLLADQAVSAAQESDQVSALTAERAKIVLCLELSPKVEADLVARVEALKERGRAADIAISNQTQFVEYQRLKAQLLERFDHQSLRAMRQCANNMTKLPEIGKDFYDLTHELQHLYRWERITY